ncbi:NAD-dependent malic enzyme 59 kDa isoform, mitochondrial [Morella rubra]|uniref:Malic enzyme n=1 Tax=Morella rubra TaxID=262757 RepID=A0A6A1VNM0_9ROSI|nr:NAD-dependent malic enzyme 59 kDa isoform, mitochondrial [Morella rubra]
MWKLARFAASNLSRSRRFSTAIPGPCIVHKRGADILHDPWFNKDTGFPLTERDRLGLRGLLPPRVISFEQQYARFMESYRSLERNTQGQPEGFVSLAKWRILNRLHDRNETLYYRVLIDNIQNFAPIIYTPTVGLVCQNYSGLFRRPRGMYFSAKDKGEMMSMIYNWPAQQVDMIVLTDGSRILALGDLGVQGIGIPIGKLDMYVAAAGINPQRILPVMLDVGTNNQKLLEDSLYFSLSDLGLRQPRLEGEEYLSIVDEFVEAVFTRWPKAIVQFEDFQMKWAFETLQRYRKRFCMFNDDIQGTAGVALAGLLGTVRAQGRPLADFVNQKIVVVGAGSAGLGVLDMAVQAASRMSGNSETVAKNQFFLVDKDGLITKERKGLDPAAAPFAKDPREIQGLREGASLLEVVKKVKPHVLLGLSGVGGIFNKEVLKAMRESDSSKPSIFAMSNPTTNEERVDEELREFLKDFKEGSLEPKGWPAHSSAYLISKAALNAYTRILAKRYPNFCINCVYPGFIKTLDVSDPASVASLGDFIRAQFGKLDILVNNAGIAGFVLDGGVEAGAPMDPTKFLEDYELAEECLQINYYGARRMAKTLIPLLELSNSQKIVNVSSSMAQLQNIPNQWAKEVLSDAENLTEEKVDEVLREFLKDFKEGSLEAKNWPTFLSAYTLSKAAMNAYTRILAKKYPHFCINCVCPGSVKTDVNYNTGILSVEEGAASPVRLALLPGGSPSGLFYVRQRSVFFLIEDGSSTSSLRWKLETPKE